MMNDSRVSVVLATSSTGGLVFHDSLILLDQIRPALSKESSDRLQTEASVNDVAYMIYTSGSTGKPKGVMNSHSAIRNRLLWMQQEYQLGPTDRVLQKTPTSFDVSVWELFWPLITGSSLVLARPGDHKDPEALARLIQSQKITTVHFVPSMLRLMLENENFANCHSLTRVLCSGEALTGDLQERFFEVSNAGLFNLYGPTEAAIDVTAWTCRRGDNRQNVPIGEPIANTQVYVLDPRQEPVPIGIAGELYIGGDQVALGYFDRPELTRERFLDDKFSTKHGAKLYRTGDLVRHLADGNIEFLGRLDNQIKLRGFRIELGEIEARILGNDSIRAASVIDVTQDHGGSILVAYVVLEPENDTAGIETEVEQRVADYRLVFDDAYAHSLSEEDKLFNIGGWNSSYTGAPVSELEMREYVDGVVARVLEDHPSHCLEIGCGTGLLLYRIAPYCQHYCGTDISSVGLQQIEESFRLCSPPITSLDLVNTPADDFSAVESTGFDQVLINSVIQLFPDMDYLTSVLRGAIEKITGTGVILVGDVRSLSLLEAFHGTVVLHQGGSTQSCESFLSGLKQAVKHDKDLVISSDYFHALQREIPEISHVQVQLKRGQHHNEFSCFRYDVKLFIRHDRTQTPPWESLRWDVDLSSVAELKTLLETNEPLRVKISRIPNARNFPAVSLIEQLAEADPLSSLADRCWSQRDKAVNRLIDPEEVWALEGDLPYNIVLDGSKTNGYFEAYIQRTNPKSDRQVISTSPRLDPAKLAPPSLNGYCKLPYRAGDHHQILSCLRDELATELPEFMRPSAYVVLEEMPLSPSGKLDRTALPKPDLQKTLDQVEYVEPTNETESQLVDIWQRVLKIDRLGIEDSFFEVGGDSLLAARMLARVHRQLGVQLPLSSLFENPTISKLSHLLGSPQEDRRTQVLVPIRTAGSQTPLFCIHAGGGNVLAYQGMPAGVGSDRPVYALQAQGIDGGADPLNCFVAMAALYIDEIQKVQPSGPYLLAGWCTGGRIAFEMARQLQQQGDSVEKLILFDSVPVAEGLPDGERLNDVELLASMSPQYEPASRRALVEPETKQMSVMLNELRSSGLLPEEASEEQISTMMVVFRSILQAETSFRLHHYDGRIILFRAEIQPQGSPRDLGWSTWTSEPIEVIDTPGDHLSLFEDPRDLDQLLMRLRSVIEESLPVTVDLLQCAK